MSASDSWEVRPLRRSDFASFRPVLLTGVGHLERSTGLDVSAEATMDQLSHLWIWFFLWWLRLFGRPPVDVLVAVDGSGVLGTGTILWLPKTAYVAGMATKPEVRGRGIASRILATQDARARQRNREWLALDTESDNETALRVYRKAGYREIAAYAWYTRSGPPPPPTATLPKVSTVRRSEWKKLTTRLDASRPEEYRAAYPARPRLLHHNEILVHGGRAESETWWKEGPNGGLGVVRAYYVPGTRMGAVFPMTTTPELPSEEIAGLFGAASEWLRARNPTRCLAVAPKTRDRVATTLEELGFSAVASTTAMVRRTSA